MPWLVSWCRTGREGGEADWKRRGSMAETFDLMLTRRHACSPPGGPAADRTSACATGASPRSARASAMRASRIEPHRARRAARRDRQRRSISASRGWRRRRIWRPAARAAVLGGGDGGVRDAEHQAQHRIRPRRGRQARSRARSHAVRPRLLCRRDRRQCGGAGASLRCCRARRG